MTCVLEREETYLGYWTNNKKDTFGVEQKEFEHTYVGQYYNGYKQWAGAHISSSKTHRTVLVSKLVLGQVNGPGLFIYPDGLIFLGNFRLGRKNGPGLYIDKYFNVVNI